MADSQLAACTQWVLDPTRLALSGSAWRDRKPPEPMCLEIGRRLLLAELEFSEWILRRVEKIAMEQDRSVSRSIALEFAVRDDAPEFVLPNGQSCWLLPVTVMRRQTLVNFDMRDANGATVLMPGIRLAQQLDQSIMLAAAGALDRELASNYAVREFVQFAIHGALPAVAWAYRHFDTARDGPLARLRSDPLFRFVAERFRHNFTLYMFTGSRSAPAGAQLVRMSFNEQTYWRHQKPVLDSADSSEVYYYQPGNPDRVNLRRSLSTVGINPIRVRFQIPGAESAASYHCEITAPDGLAIVKATLLAGRPNNPTRHTSEDTIVGHTPVAGLHAVEIPNGSLCRVQVDLGIPARGWLTSVCLSTMAITGVLLSVALHWHRDVHLNTEQITNVVLILLTTSAAVAGLVAQRDSGSIAARFVAGLRALGTVALLLPLFVAGVLAYSGLAAHARPGWMAPLLWTTFGVSAAISIIFVAATVRSSLAQRHSVARESPWDQTKHPDADASDRPPPESRPNFKTKVEEYGFDSAAVGIQSAEGWHERYAWTDSLQELAVWSLQQELGDDLASGLPSRCTRRNAPNGVVEDGACSDCISVGLPLSDRRDRRHPAT